MPLMYNVPIKFVIYVSPFVEKLHGASGIFKEHIYLQALKGFGLQFHFRKTMNCFWQNVPTTFFFLYFFSDIAQCITDLICGRSLRYNASVSVTFKKIYLNNEKKFFKKQTIILYAISLL